MEITIALAAVYIILNLTVYTTVRRTVYVSDRRCIEQCRQKRVHATVYLYVYMFCSQCTVYNKQCDLTVLVEKKMFLRVCMTVQCMSIFEAFSPR